MPINIKWANSERNIMLMEISGSWTSEEFANASAEALAKIHIVSHSVDLLADAREAIGLPKDVFKVLHYALSLPNFPKNARSQIIVSKNPAINVMVNFADKMSPFTVSTKIVGTIEEAYQIIQKLDEKERG